MKSLIISQNEILIELWRQSFFGISQSLDGLLGSIWLGSFTLKIFHRWQTFPFELIDCCLSSYDLGSHSVNVSLQKSAKPLFLVCDALYSLLKNIFEVL